MTRDLRNLDVLIDSLDLSLPNGTGIKSYGLSLISALKQIGANPELLVSARGNKNPLVARAMLYDPAARQERAVRGWPKAFKHFLFKSKEANYLPPNKTIGYPVPDSVFPYGLGCSTLFNCYRVAQTLQARFKKTSTFRTKKNYHIWHATQPLPLRHESAVQVTTIHDLIPILQPHFCDEILPLFYQRVEEAVRHSRAIAVVSEHTKKDLQNYFSVPDGKLTVVHPVSHMSRETCSDREIDQTMKILNLRRDGYILCVGTLEFRKNLRRLVEAYLRLDSDLTLVLVGKMGYGGAQELEIVKNLKSRSGQEVRLLDYVPNYMMPSLYQGASCLAFPSLYEGFGIPVLEAMINGCPVVCSSTTSLPEVAGSAAHYIDPEDSESITNGLAKVLGDSAYRATLVQEGRVRAAFFSEERFTGQIAELYRKALG
jgi:glycosyltransferase involved in cell wall biosynthesis